MFNFTSRYPAAIGLILLAVSVLISVFFYRKSLLPNYKKYFLIALKSLAVFLLLLLFIEPSLITIVNKNVSVSGIVLVDNSRSIGLLYPGKNSKKEEALSLLKENDLNKTGNKYFTFSSGTALLTNKDSLGFNGYQTDLSSALTNIRNMLPDEQVSSLTIISDGNFNAGGNPLYKTALFQCPVITIGLGDTVQRKDAVIETVIYAYDLQSAHLTVNLLREGAIISTKAFDIKSNPWSGEAEFDIMESNPGIVHYTVRIENQPGEITYKNNYSDFLIDYINNKINILFISGGPGYDDALFTGILRRINNYNITVRTSKNASEFYEGGIDYKTFPELSALFLLNFPTSQTGNDILSNIASKSREFNVPLIFFAGKNTDYKKLASFEEQLPFSISGAGNEIEFYPQVISNSGNPFADISGEISSAPVIFRNVSGVIQKTGTEVVMTDKSSGVPVMINRNEEKNKSSAFLGYGLWKWRLAPNTDREKTAEKLILQTINTTLQKEKRTKLKVYPAKDIFDYTEPPVIYAEVYDDNFQLTRNAVIKGKVFSKDKSVVKDIVFNINENRYESVLPMIPAGDYTIEA
jgi:hypothetical protein